jgi:hypothetical protein
MKEWIADFEYDAIIIEGVVIMIKKPNNLLRTVAEGLTGYMTYQSRCGIAPAYSEYLLYDPILRVAKDKNWTVESEFVVEETTGKGDHKRVDFFLTSNEDSNLVIGIEVKWFAKRKRSIDLTKDVAKLLKLKEIKSINDISCYLVLAGVHKGNIMAEKEERIPKLKGALSKIYYQTVYDTNWTHYGVTIIKI